MKFTEKYDWETRDDGEILLKAAEVQNDPFRLKKAKAKRKEKQNNTSTALGVRYRGSGKKHCNNATVGKLDYPRL